MKLSAQRLRNSPKSRSISDQAANLSHSTKKKIEGSLKGAKDVFVRQKRLGQLSFAKGQKALKGRVKKAGTRAALFAKGIKKRAPAFFKQAVLATCLAANLAGTFAPAAHAMMHTNPVEQHQVMPASQCYSPLMLQIDNMQSEQAPSIEVVEVGTQGAEVKEVQQNLSDLGFQPGGVDGHMGPKTQDALKRFQAANDLEVTGSADAATQIAMSQALESLATSGEAITKIQQSLEDLGFRPGGVDGDMGPKTERALKRFQAANNLEITGVADAATQNALDCNPQSLPEGGLPLPDHVPQLERYAPNSDAAVALFAEAAKLVDVPEAWASDPGLHQILKRESNGDVGVPNYSYGERTQDKAQWESIHQELKNGERTTVSSATGLGQLLIANVDVHYPSGVEGIGNPLEEAAGMLSYIKDRYETPANAWANYGVHHEGY